MIPTVPELQRRLLYALLQPAIGLCRQFRIPIDVLETLSRLAYYEALRSHGAKQADVATVFGKSLRTVVGVEKMSRTDFLAPEAEVRSARRIEEALAEGPSTVHELAAALELPADDVERLLEGLTEAGRAHRSSSEPPTFTASERFLSLVRDDLLARLGGLHHQLEVILATVHRRFFAANDSRPSAARTLSFVGTEAEVQALADELIRVLRARAVEVEERSLEQPGHQRYALTFALAPMPQSEHVKPTSIGEIK
jgi:hypothetical protein